MTLHDSSDALVTGAYSRRMTLRLADGASVEARIKGKRLRPVCGDRVSASRIAGESDWLITAIHPRSNELTRPDSRGRKEVLAANLDCVVVMAAAVPTADWFIVDRYLAAAENMDAEAVVVFNKTDLIDAGDGLPAELADYAAAGYTAMACSAETGENLAILEETLADKTAIVVGQSGVGKSRIINELLGSGEQRIAALSRKHREGRHTTVNSLMLELPGGARVVDSPGVRDYAPALETEAEVMRGYREIDARKGQCRFANCLHLHEPDCAVKQAVDAGDVSPRRYESYRRLITLTKKRLEKNL